MGGGAPEIARQARCGEGAARRVGRRRRDAAAVPARGGDRLPAGAPQHRRGARLQHASERPALHRPRVPPGRDARCAAGRGAVAARGGAGHHPADRLGAPGRAPGRRRASRPQAGQRLPLHPRGGHADEGEGAGFRHLEDPRLAVSPDAGRHPHGDAPVHVSGAGHREEHRGGRPHRRVRPGGHGLRDARRPARVRRRLARRGRLPGGARRAHPAPGARPGPSAERARGRGARAAEGPGRAAPGHRRVHPRAHRASAAQLSHRTAPGRGLRAGAVARPDAHPAPHGPDHVLAQDARLGGPAGPLRSVDAAPTPRARPTADMAHRRAGGDHRRRRWRGGRPVEREPGTPCAAHGRAPRPARAGEAARATARPSCSSRHGRRQTGDPDPDGAGRTEGARGSRGRARDDRGAGEASAPPRSPGPARRHQTVRAVTPGGLGRASEGRGPRDARIPRTG